MTRAKRTERVKFSYPVMVGYMSSRCHMVQMGADKASRTRSIKLRLFSVTDIPPKTTIAFSI